jgi:hypothetical protein
MFLKKHKLMEERQGEAGADGGIDAGAAAAASAAAKAGAGDGANSGGADAGAAGGADAGKSDWAPDWRLKAAGGDEKVAKSFERFASPKALADSYRALNQRLSSGELRSMLPKDAKPEEVAKWRTENGIPEKPEAYEMPEGLVVGEEDKAGVNEFLTAMHGANATPAQVQAGLNAYYKIKEQSIAALGESDVAHRDEVQDTLRAEWGAEYRGNVNSINAFLDMAPAGVKEKLLSARMPDGRAVANDPDMMRTLIAWAREVNPVGTVVPAGGDQMGAIDTEIDKIRKVMREDRKAYDRDEKMQERFRQLLEARDKRK